MTKPGCAFCWGALVVLLVFPIWAASNSPLLQWREPTYIVAGFAGITALSLLLLQPLLARALVPCLSLLRAKALHRAIGIVLVVAVLVHVVGLWITSPPDVLDALLFASPTPFSVWGVLAMWGLFASALLVASRQKLRLRAATWRALHKCIGAGVVICSVVHALLIDGTMETISKWLICLLVLVALLLALTNTNKLRK